MDLSYEYLKLIQKHISSHMVHSIESSPRIWKYPNPRNLKIDIDVSFDKGKIGIDIVIRNHFNIPLLAKALPYLGRFYVDYSELLRIIEGYIASSTLPGQ